MALVRNTVPLCKPGHRSACILLSLHWVIPRTGTQVPAISLTCLHPRHEETEAHSPRQGDLQPCVEQLPALDRVASPAGAAAHVEENHRAPVYVSARVKVSACAQEKAKSREDLGQRVSKHTQKIPGSWQESGFPGLAPSNMFQDGAGKPAF